MSDDTPPMVLVDYLTKHYTTLKSRMTRLLGNGDLAGDALQDTWLRVHSREEDEPIHSPAGYLLRMAVNIAVDIQRRQGRALPLDEIAELMDMADPSPGPEQIAEARSRVEALRQFIDAMPKRRRQIVLMVHWDGLEQKEVARRLGVSLRTVESDLKRAHDYLIARKDR
ncbi:RNA polymerase sigma factor [Pandoraea communis]|uniref:ECF subfamily RNA polymerase sigma factor n=1 Tax=Pandoraea communis TaxID=2508297 RepID=A0A5E4YJZ3_9BURK|nr:RNA polymerase sigma factor [Pandoraea communis]MDM8358839.1 RNA polymerase sigma factor [Pandoraea communis]VVE00429.1 ECF subfamily RNA polymerase sigma factor [Pandoraea communis]VVE49049.1 ECF subfamily RNA polymerase sigma factor [Pandoraea communis]